LVRRMETQTQTQTQSVGVVRLEEIKRKYATALTELGEELMQKYPERAELIGCFVKLIMYRINTLSSGTVAKLLLTLAMACWEFQELCRLMSSPEDLKELYKALQGGEVG